jgi:hypothetical protein
VEEGEHIPNCMLHTDNPYDVAIDIAKKSLLFTNDSMSILKNLQTSLAEKVSTNIMQNARIIYTNGIRAFLANFMTIDELKAIDTSFYLSTSNIRIYPEELFCESPSTVQETFHNRPKSIIPSNPEAFDTIFDNNIKIHGILLEQYAYVYINTITKALATSPRVAAQITEFAMNSDGIDYKEYNESIHISYATHVLNQIATDDLYKLQDIITIAGTQIVSEYVNTTCKLNTNKCNVNIEQITEK